MSGSIAGSPADAGGAGRFRLTARLLGPMEVRLDGRPVPVRAPQERALLALLLLTPDRVVSVPEIVSGLWGEYAPRGADKTVQSYVSRLRRALGVHGSRLVVTRAPGYLVVAEPGAVDAVRFARLADEGHRTLSAGDARRAVTVLREASALWRGEALAEFDAPFARRERARLTELRLVGIEDRMSADLALGAGAELVGDLEKLVAEHPLRERLWEHLITALYRAGRQADALAAYRRIRSVLVQELAIEPGPRLRDLERMVLGQDPGLIRDRAEAAPALLPPALAVTDPPLVGRVEELNRLTAAYRQTADRGVVCRLLNGPPGMGKTRLAAALAAAVQAEGAVVEYATAGEATFRWPGWTRRPALVVCDDLQKADPADLDGLVAQLTGADGPLLALLIVDGEALSTEQRAALDKLSAPCLELGPLPADAVAAIVASYVDGGDMGTAAAATAAAGGNPAAVHRAARDWAERRARQLVDGAARELPVAYGNLAGGRDLLVRRLLDLQRTRDGRLLAAPSGATVCPYKGLAAFDTADADYFFGRRRLVAQLVTRLVGVRLLAVVGASGVGKSSVIRAGLLPALHAGSLPGSAAWRTVVVTPAEKLPGPARDPGRRVVVIDQFEEVFTGLDKQQRSAYLDELTALIEAPDEITCVLILRADYYSRCAERKELAARLAENTVLVGPMDPDELRAAIEGPAERAGLIIEPGLTDVLLADVRDQPGALSLLSTALLALWEHREDNRLTMAGYLRTGGVRHAIARLAESAYAPLTEAQRLLARRILLRLADQGDSGDFVRRRARLTEVAPDDEPDAREVVDVLARRRLVTVTGGSVEIAHEAVLREWPRLTLWLEEDAIGRRLRAHLTPAAQDWASRDRDPAELYRGTRLAAALDWASDHPDELTRIESDFLTASRAATQADTRRRKRTIRRLRALAVALAAVLAVALAAGTLAVLQRKRAERETLSADARALRAAAVAEQQADLALLYAAQAHRLQPTDETRAALLSVLQRSPEAVGIMRGDPRLLRVAASADGSTVVTGDNQGRVIVWDPVTHHRRATFDAVGNVPTFAVDLSDDGRWLAAVSYLIPPPGLTGDAAVLVVVDLHAARPVPRRMPISSVVAVRFGPGGRTLLVRRQDGRIQEIGRGRGEVVRDFAAAANRHECAEPYLDSTPDRRYVASGCAGTPERPAGVWDVRSGRMIWKSPATSIPEIDAISPDGTTVLRAGWDGTIRTVRLPTGRAGPIVRAHAAPINSVVWPPDGRTFATASVNEAVVWDAVTLRQRLTLRGHTARIMSMAYAPDSRTLYTAGQDQKLYTWDLIGRARVAQPLSTFPASSDVTESHRFVQTGTALVTLYPGTGPLQVQTLSRTGTPTDYTLPRPGIRQEHGLDVDAAGHTVAIMGVDKATGQLVARLLDLPGRRYRPLTIPVGTTPPTVPPGADAVHSAMSLSADGAILTTVDFNGTVRRWDTATGALRHDFSYQSSQPMGYAERGPDPHVLALSTGYGTVDLIDLRQSRRLWATTVPRASSTGPPVFSPDGRLIAVGTWQGEIAVIDAATGAVRRQWQAADGYLATQAFTLDNRYLVTGDADGRAKLWNLDTAPVGPAILDVNRPAGRPVVVAVAPDGRILTAGVTGPVLSWDVDPARLVARACATVGRNLSLDEWNRLLPDRPYQRTCPENP